MKQWRVRVLPYRKTKFLLQEKKTNVIFSQRCSFHNVTSKYSAQCRCEEVTHIILLRLPTKMLYNHFYSIFCSIFPPFDCKCFFLFCFLQSFPKSRIFVDVQMFGLWESRKKNYRKFVYVQQVKFS